VSGYYQVWDAECRFVLDEYEVRDEARLVAAQFNKIDRKRVEDAK
jgi:hypothetical protein